MSLAETKVFFDAPESDLKVTDELLEQVAVEADEIIKITGRNVFSFTEDLHSPQMGIRGFIRAIVLEKSGFDGEKWAEKRKVSNLPSVWLEIRDVKNEHLFTGEPNDVPNSQSILDLAGEPDFYNYNWQYVIMWELGDFKQLTSKVHENGHLVLTEAGVVLFADELEKLQSGETVTTLHASGFEHFGWLNEEKDVYKVVDNNLVRVNASLSD